VHSNRYQALVSGTPSPHTPVEICSSVANTLINTRMNTHTHTHTHTHPPTHIQTSKTYQALVSGTPTPRTPLEAGSPVANTLINTRTNTLVSIPVDGYPARSMWRVIEAFPSVSPVASLVQVYVRVCVHVCVGGVYLCIHVLVRVRVRVRVRDCV